jgi:hypothetical protein
VSGLSRTGFRVETSRAIYRLLREKMADLTYSDVAKAVGTSHRSLGGPLGILQEECDAKGWPTITGLCSEQDPWLSKHRM